MISPWIHTTDTCNLNCSYCHVKGNNVMAKNVYDAIDKLLSKNCHIRIGGGEPLLVYNNWCNWVKKYNSVEVLTNFRNIPNGYFNMNFNTSVSIDGFGEKPLDKEIINNMSKLKNQPWIMTTLIDTNNLTQLAEFVAKNNYGWAISTNYIYDNTPDKCDIILAMNDVIKVLVKYNYNFNQFVFNNIDFVGRGGCCSGKEMFSIYCDGTIFPCQTCHNNKNKKIGDVFTGYKQIECKKTSTLCSNCSINDVCTGWCSLHHTPGNDICDVMKFVSLEVTNAK